MDATIRKYLLPLHRWIGCTIGLVIALMAATGASILYRPQLEPVLNRQLLTVPACINRVTLDVLTATAVAARPDATLDYIRLAVGDDTDTHMPAVAIRYTDQSFIYLDPCTGAVLGQRHRYGGLLGTLEQIHRFRFIDHGNLITGTSALVFVLVSILGGLYMWWPASSRSLKRAVRFNRRLVGQARTAALHKTVGLYASFILAASALSGLPLAFDWYKHGLYLIAGSPVPASPPKSRHAGMTRLPMETIWQRAQELVPMPREALLHYPHKPGDAVDMYLIAHDAPHANARTMLHLDAYTGKVLAFVPYAASSSGHKLYFWLLSWHTGRVGGVPAQFLMLMAALSVPVLAYTGIAGYLRRRRRAAMSPRLMVKVTAKRVEAQGICSFELSDARGRPLPPFTAGAHIDVYLRDGSLRQYSLCNNPRDTHRYLICVQREPKSRGGSRTLHDDVQQGHILEIGFPKNRFEVDAQARRSLLIAGGIGVAPILSMAEYLAGIGAEFTMHYCTRTKPRTAFIDRIRNASYANRVSFHFSDGPAEQLMDTAALLRNTPPDTHLYVCGPTGFMTVVIDIAKNLGWPDRQLHKEYFSAEVMKSDKDTSFEIKLASTGKVLQVAKDKTALQVLSECGIDVPRSCEKGVCGTCVTRVLEGEPDHRDMFLTEEERKQNGLFTPCCSRARSSMLVLDI